MKRLSVLLALALPACQPTEQKEPDDSRERMIQRAQGVIKNGLISPGSAIFPPLDSKDGYTVEFKDGEWFVAGYVDSHNRAGALIRSNWWLQIYKDGGEFYTHKRRILPR